jgi:purine-cytosine permease-like protein
VLALSSLCVVAANFLRVKIFATFGLLSFLVDLIAIVYIVLSHQKIDTLMVLLGAGLTLIGFITIGGYYMYRQQKETIDALFRALKDRFQSWE